MHQLDIVWITILILKNVEDIYNVTKDFYLFFLTFYSSRILKKNYHFFFLQKIFFN